MKLMLLIIGMQLPSWAIAQVDLKAQPFINAQEDWPWWRGLTRDGHAVGSAPSQLDLSSNLDWEQAIPGRGHGSPIVVGNGVFLLTADEQRQVHSVVALDRRSGKPLWETKINTGGFPEENHPKNTEASPTIASDGQRLIVATFHHQAIHVYSLKLDGQKEWEQRIGDYNPTRYRYGYAPSPVIYGDLAIIAFEYDGPSALVAIDKKTGKQVWKTERPSNITFSSPVVTSHAGRDYLLISGYDHIQAYDPATGKELWSTPGASTATCGTIVWDSGIVFASGGYPQAETIALDIVTGQALWKNRQRCYEQSMVAINGYLYAFTDSGFLICWNAKTGDEQWRQRLTDKISASGVVAQNKIYWANEAGDLWIFEANPQKYIELSKNKIGDEAFASPAICGGHVYLRVARNQSGRRQEYVLRFSDKKL